MPPRTPRRSRSGSWRERALERAVELGLGRDLARCPTDEPEPRGLDEHRQARAPRALAPAVLAVARARSPTCGTPARASSSLKTTLSMRSAEASTPAPTYGTSSSSSRPWTVPSSPNGPCSTGKATSAPSSPPAGSSATGARRRGVQRPSRSMQHRRTTSWPASREARRATDAAGRERDLVLAASGRRRGPRPSRDAPGVSSSASACSVGGSSTADDDHDRRALVEPASPGRGRCVRRPRRPRSGRSTVRLRRPASSPASLERRSCALVLGQADRRPARPPAARRRRDDDRDRRALATSCPRPGSCAITLPLGSSTSCSVDARRSKPASRERVSAESRAGPTTSGTSTCSGPR